MCCEEVITGSRLAVAAGVERGAADRCRTTSEDMDWKRVGVEVVSANSRG